MVQTYGKMGKDEWRRGGVGVGVGGEEDGLPVEGRILRRVGYVRRGLDKTGGYPDEGG